MESFFYLFFIYPCDWFSGPGSHIRKSIGFHYRWEEADEQRHPQETRRTPARVSECGRG